MGDLFLMSTEVGGGDEGNSPPLTPLRKRSFSQPESSFKAHQKRTSQAPVHSSPFLLVNAEGETPQERYGHSAVVDVDGDGGEGILYVFGGSNSIQNHFFSNELFAFYFRTRRWVALHPQPDPIDPEEENESDSVSAQVDVISDILWPQGRHFHSAVVFHHKMIICGGKSNGYMNDVYSYDFRTREWEEIVAQGDTRMNKRYGHTAVIYNEQMYIFGGYDDFGLSCNDLWRFDFDTREWERIQPLGRPPERYHHSAVAFEGSLYVFGGFQGYNDLFEYRFGSRTWSTVNTKGAPPNARWGHCAIVVKRCMYIFGGCDLVVNYNDLHRFHFDSSRWETLSGEGYMQGYFQTVSLHKNRLYIFGGKNVHNYNFNELYEYRVDVESKANPNTFEQDFRNMLYDNDFTDVVFRFPEEGRTIRAHRCILFARCAKFRDLISTHGGRFAQGKKSVGDSAASSTLKAKPLESKNRGKRNKSRLSDTVEEKDRGRRKKKKASRTRKRDNAIVVPSPPSTPIHSVEPEEPKEVEPKNETKNEEEELTVFPEVQEIEVIVESTTYDTFRRFLEYIYSGYFDKSQPHAIELLPLASDYGSEHLKKMCAIKIQLGIEVSNVLEALRLADACKADELKSFCLSFIAEHRAEVSPALRKGELHPDLLKEVKKWLTVQSLEKLQSNSTPVYQSILT